MTNETKKKGADVFANAFAESIGGSLAEATGAPLSLEIKNSPDATLVKGTPVHFRLTAEGGLSGDCFVEFYEQQAAVLVSKITKQPVAEFAEEHGEILGKALLSAMSGLALALAQKYGAITFKVDRVAGLAFGGMFVVPLASTQEDSKIQVLLYFGGQLLEALSGTQDPASAREVEVPALQAKNLKLVMDVELNVSLRFGQRQMPLREVLELASGSVIELDRMVDEPVELFLDGKLIARGEAVVVDGNYGLRVTEIPQPVANHFLN